MVDLTKLPGPERSLLAPLRPGPDSWDPPTPLTTDDQLLLDLLATHTYKCPTSLRDLARHLPESARPLGEQDLARRLDALAEQLTGRCRIHLGPDGVRLEEPDRGILLRHAELEDGTHAVIVLPFLSVCVYDPWDRQRPRRESLRPSLLRILTALVVAEGRPVPAQQLSDASGTSNLEHRVAELRRLQLPIPIGSSSGYRLAAVREALRRYPLAIDLARGHVWQYGRCVEIGELQMAVLDCIAQRACRPVAGSDICAEVWRHANPGVVKQAVHRLRKWLAASWGANLILTGRDAAGRATYRLNEPEVRWLDD